MQVRRKQSRNELIMEESSFHQLRMQAKIEEQNELAKKMKAERLQKLKLGEIDEKRGLDDGSNSSQADEEISSPK